MMTKKYYIKKANIICAKKLIKIAKLLISNEIIEENKANSIIDELTESIEDFENSGKNMAENLGEALENSNKIRIASSDINNLIKDCKRATIEFVNSFNNHHLLKTASNEQQKV